MINQQQDGQRNAIAQALMNVQQPPPQPQMQRMPQPQQAQPAPQQPPPAQMAPPQGAPVPQGPPQQGGVNLTAPPQQVPVGQATPGGTPWPSMLSPPGQSGLQPASPMPWQGTTPPVPGQATPAGVPPMPPQMPQGY
jgi:hypothetical protein